MVSTHYIVIGVVAVLAALHLFLNARAPVTPPPAPLVEEDVADDGSPADWTDLLDQPYDAAVSLLRTKYGETFPIMVVREGETQSTPVEKAIMYLWVDDGGVVRKYSYDESDDPAILHGGIVRRYDRI